MPTQTTQDIEDQLAERMAAAAAQLPSEGETRNLVVSRGMWREFAAAIVAAASDLQNAPTEFEGELEEGPQEPVDEEEIDADATQAASTDGSDYSQT